MMTVARLRRKPCRFRAFTGLSVAEFDRLLAEAAPACEAARQCRRQQPGRQREDTFCLVAGRLNFRAAGRFTLA